MLNKKLFLFCLTLIVLIILINVSGSISKFGSDNVVNITIASSDIAKTTFSLTSKQVCNSQAVCEPRTYSYSGPPPPTPDDLPDYLAYLKNNLFNNVSINVLHCNFKNTLYDYQGQIFKEDYISGLGSISCTEYNNTHGVIINDDNVTISITPGSIPPQPVTLYNRDLFIITQDRYINYGLYSKPTVYQYVDNGIRDGNCPSSNLVTDCGQGNIIKNTICGGCNFDLVVNGIIPDIEIPTIKVYNGVTFTIGSEVVSTDFIDNKGDACYLIPKLFMNNVNITIPFMINIEFKDFAIKVRPLIGTNSYITRIDAIPTQPFFVIYYTTLDDNYSYVSDSYILIDIRTYSMLGQVFTTRDINHKLSDLHLNINFYCVAGRCGISDRAEIAITTPLLSINTTAGDGHDYNFLKALLYTNAVPYNNIWFSVQARAQSTYDSGPVITEMTSSLLNGLTAIQCNVSIWFYVFYVSSQIECWFYDATGNTLWSDHKVG